jgi:hypothetical protein
MALKKLEKSAHKNDAKGKKLRKEKAYFREEITDRAESEAATVAE